MQPTYSAHLSNQMRHPELLSNNILHVIGVMQNPARVNARYRLFRNWAEEMAQTPNVQLHVLEAVYKDQKAECYPLNGEYNYKSVNITQHIWLKENLLNIACRTLLPWNWGYMAWVDTDIAFHNNNWAQDSLHALQHAEYIQPWSDCIDLNSNGSVYQTTKSFCWGMNNEKQNADPSTHKYLKYFHTGYAHACTRYFYENVGKLFDYGILGSGDNHMCWATQGRVLDTINSKMSEGYKKVAVDWQTAAVRATNSNVGYTNGAISHNWHGSKGQRGYKSRWQILVNDQYDPTQDIRYDRQGVLTLVENPKLEQDIMKYNFSRNEDQI